MTSEEIAAPVRLVVALDGSRLAETVLPLTETLAAGLDAEVTLLHVLEFEPPQTVHGEPHLSTATGAEAYLAQVADHLRRAGVKVTTHVHTDPTRDVASGIAAHASELSASMIVLAAHGHGGLHEWLVGRIPQQVTARAGRPVLIVPAPTEGDLAIVRRVMLPIDMAGEADAAIPWARHLAAACQAEVILVTIVPTSTTMPGDAGVAGLFLPHAAASLLDWMENEARARLGGLATSLRQSGLAVTTEVHRGNPAQELIQDIANHGVDLVVMATHARAGLDGLLAGSVTPRVVSSMPCPLLLVPITG